MQFCEHWVHLAMLCTFPVPAAPSWVTTLLGPSPRQNGHGAGRGPGACPRICPPSRCGRCRLLPMFPPPAPALARAIAEAPQWGSGLPGTTVSSPAACQYLISWGMSLHSQVSVFTHDSGATLTPTLHWPLTSTSTPVPFLRSSVRRDLPSPGLQHPNTWSESQKHLTNGSPHSQGVTCGEGS